MLIGVTQMRTCLFYRNQRIWEFEIAEDIQNVQKYKLMLAYWYLAHYENNYTK